MPLACLLLLRTCFRLGLVRIDGAEVAGRRIKEAGLALWLVLDPSSSVDGRDAGYAVLCVELGAWAVEVRVEAAGVREVAGNGLRKQGRERP